MTVFSPDTLDFMPYEGDIRVAKIDWFDLLQAKVFFYPKGHEIGPHRLSNNILQVILKGKVAFRQINGIEEIAESGMLHQCWPSVYTTQVLEDSYIVIVEKEPTKTIMVSV
jgi:hypothetical protein